MSLVKVFLEHGFTVFAGVYKPICDSQINEIQDKENLYTVDLDITDFTSINEAAAFVSGHAQKLDIIINNAGVIPVNEIHENKKSIFDELDYDAMLEAINVNSLGANRCIWHFP